VAKACRRSSKPLRLTMSTRIVFGAASAGTSAVVGAVPAVGGAEAVASSSSRSRRVRRPSVASGGATTIFFFAGPVASATGAPGLAAGAGIAVFAEREGKPSFSSRLMASLPPCRLGGWAAAGMMPPGPPPPKQRPGRGGRQGGAQAGRSHAEEPGAAPAQSFPNVSRSHW